MLDFSDLGPDFSDLGLILKFYATGPWSFPLRRLCFGFRGASIHPRFITSDHGLQEVLGPVAQNLKIKRKSKKS